MGFFKNLKKSAKKLTLKKVGKALAEATGGSANIVGLLPAPVGPVAQKVATLAHKVNSKSKKVKKELSSFSGVANAMAMVSSSKGKSSSPAPVSGDVPMVVETNQSRRLSRMEKRKIRQMQREAKRRAKRDGYLKYKS